MRDLTLAFMLLLVALACVAVALSRPKFEPARSCLAPGNKVVDCTAIPHCERICAELLP